MAFTIARGIRFFIVGEYLVQAALALLDSLAPVSTLESLELWLVDRLADQFNHVHLKTYLCSSFPFPLRISLPNEIQVLLIEDCLFLLAIPSPLPCFLPL